MWNPKSGVDIWHGTISTNRRFGMVKFINRLTGTVMWVAEDRVDEYKVAGHKLAAETSTPTKEVPKKRKTTKK